MAETSSKQAEANRLNARKSTGPRTPDGKRKSSKNALKHGMTSKDVVLPNEDPAEFKARLDHWNSFYIPACPAEAAMIEQAVNAKRKHDRINRVETQKLSEKVRHAVDRYDLEKFTDAEGLGQRLCFEPLNRCVNPQIHDPVVRGRIEQRQNDIPAILTRQLQITAQGCNLLIERWIELGEMLKLHGYWHYTEKFRVIRLLGRNPEDVLEDLLVQRIFLACNVLHPDTQDGDPDGFDLWDECYQAKLGIEGKPMYMMQAENIRKLRPKDKLAAQAILWDIFAQEVSRLKDLKKHYLDPLDDADRAGAQDRAMFDDSKEAVLMRRYETACEREFHRAIAGMQKLQKAPLVDLDDDSDEADTDTESAPLQNEPIAEPAQSEAVTENAPVSEAVKTAPDRVETYQPTSKRQQPAGSGVETPPDDARRG